MSGLSSEIKIGIVGLDSSHAPKYTELLQDTSHPHHVSGGRIVAAYAGGSDNWELSYARLPGFRAEMADRFDVPIHDSIEAVAEASDALMILSVDGRVHRAQFETVTTAAPGKPIYVDKPLACAKSEAQAMAGRAAASDTPVFSSSVWRFAPGVIKAQAAMAGGSQKAKLHGMWPLHPGLHGWAFYGVHHIELLYALMGSGCERVRCENEGSHETITGYWPHGRTGTITTDHEKETPFAGEITGGDGQPLALDLEVTISELYSAFLTKALEFFRGDPVPVPLTETCETIAFLESAWRSRESAGEVMPLPSC
ncbi:MAG: Gfo/Idh/MocA family oxidoreductase [Synoicihabitans sp.]